MRSRDRHPALIGLALALAVGLLPTATVTATTTDAAVISAAERTAFDLTNLRRTNAGLVRLRVDARLAALARQRAEYMATTDTFSHTQADGTSVFDLMSAGAITWYGAGEIIAWNTAAALDYSASFAVQGWMASPPHRAIVMSADFNYVGFGLAISPSTGRRYWAGVYMKGPDRTSAWARISSVSKRTVDEAFTRVTVSWAGRDTRLQVLTSGLRYFQMQKRRDGGAWYTYDRTTATSLTRTWRRGHVYDFRVRARDKAGNWGAWSQVTVRP